MIIQHNIMALNAHRQLGGNTNLVSKNLEKLSSGYKINRAGDDAAGLAISEKMRAQITGLTRAQANAQDGISLVQTAEGALTEVHSMLNRMVDLSTQSSNGTLQSDDRQKIQDEMDALTAEIGRISQSTNFNGINLLDGSLGGGAVTGAAGAAGTPGTLAFTAGSTATTGITGITLGNAFSANGNVSITSAQVAAKADSGTSTVSGATGAKLDSTSATGGALTGKTVKVVAGANAAAGGVSIAADGTVTLTLDKTKFDNEANFKLELNRVKALTATGGTAAEKAAVAALTYTDGTGGGWTTGIGAADGDVMGTFAMGGGNVDSTKITVTDGTTTLNATLADTAVVTGALALVDDADPTKTASITVGTAATVTGSFVATISGVVSGANAAGQGVSTAKFSEFKEGNTLTFKIGGADVVLEMVKAGEAAKTTGAIAVSLSANADAPTALAADLASIKTAYDAAVAADGTGNQPAMVTTADGFTLTAAAGTTAAPAVKLGGGGLILQIGDTADAFNKVSVSVADMSAKGLGIDGIKVGAEGVASSAIKTIKDAIETVSVNRSAMGALQNRLEHTINNLGVTTENMTAAESRVRDVDMAKEMMTFTKNNVLTQAAQAMLAQANQQPQQVLQLLR